MNCMRSNDIAQGRRKLFYGQGTDQKCRPPWLANDEKFNKGHVQKCLKEVPAKNETLTKI